ncbi:MAG: LysM peptidoglycan-binding domain-containing protein, partial [Bacteroidetes bacterium]|nr:LysM peptidoglycan-binding domain-containing protein [Bacteroidota bacterium]
CPVCNAPVTDKNARTCPECGSRLEAYGFIEHIQNKIRKFSLTIIILCIVLVACIVLLVLTNLFRFTGVSTEEDVHQQETSVPEQFDNDKIITLRNENTFLKSTVDSLKNEISGLKEIISGYGNKPGSTEENDSGQSQSGIYIVQKGETLFSIAEKVYGSCGKYQRLVNDNHISDPNLIMVGQKLKITK